MNDPMRTLALEILKAKCDLAATPINEIYSQLMDILSKLRKCEKQRDQKKSL